MADKHVTVSANLSLSEAEVARLKLSSYGIDACVVHERTPFRPLPSACGEGAAVQVNPADARTAKEILAGPAGAEETRGRGGLTYIGYVLIALALVPLLVPQLSASLEAASSAPSLLLGAVFLAAGALLLLLDTRLTQNR